MYIHIGQDFIIPEQSIVGIYDMDTATLSKHTRKFLSEMEKNGAVVSLFEDLPRACIHCVEGGESVLYLTQLSPAALQKRCGRVPE